MSSWTSKVNPILYVSPLPTLLNGILLHTPPYDYVRTTSTSTELREEARSLKADVTEAWKRRGAKRAKIGMAGTTARPGRYYRQDPAGPVLPHLLPRLYRRTPPNSRYPKIQSFAPSRYYRLGATGNTGTMEMKPLASTVLPPGRRRCYRPRKLTNAKRLWPVLPAPGPVLPAVRNYFQIRAVKTIYLPVLSLDCTLLPLVSGWPIYSAHPLIVSLDIDDRIDIWTL